MFRSWFLVVFIELIYILIIIIKVEKIYWEDKNWEE